MKQSMAREIVQRIPSLYSLQTVEEEAILALINPKDLVCNEIRGGEDVETECPNCGYELAHGNFCSECGQPLTDEHQ